MVVRNRVSDVYSCYTQYCVFICVCLSLLLHCACMFADDASAAAPWSTHMHSAALANSTAAADKQSACCLHVVLQL